MNKYRPISEHIQAYANNLRLEEKSAATIEKYLRDIRGFARWLGGREITKEQTAAWKAYLVEQGYAPASVNAMLSALNSLLDFLGFADCRVKFLKLQRRMFRDDSRDLTRSDYDALTAAAKSQGKERLALLMETSNPSQGRLRGKTDENLVVTGQDKYYLKAAGYGRLYDFGYDADGAPISERVARHVTGVAQFAVAFNELGLGNLVINGIPSYVDMAADIGQFLAPD